MYHRVLPEEEVTGDVKPGMFVTPATFRRHLGYLADQHAVINLEELAAWSHGQRSFDRVPCVITFDDGWGDNYVHAFPLLRQHGLTATIFLATGLIGRPKMLTWEQVREMETAGMHFGSHTVTHPVLTHLPEPAIREELSESRERLRREVARPSRWFCYPKGAYNAAALRVAREYYAGALCTEEGPVAQGDDLHRIRRISVHDDVTRTTPLFICRLLSLV